MDVSKDAPPIVITVLAEVTTETARHPDLVFQQHLRNLINVYKTREVTNEVIRGILEWEATNLTPPTATT